MGGVMTLSVELNIDAERLIREVRIISRHLEAMANELELAGQIGRAEHVLCDYCRQPVGANGQIQGGRVYCSRGCLEMAGMERPDSGCR